MEEFETTSCIQGSIWTPIFGERLVCKNEPGNPKDQCAVTVCKGDDIVGYLQFHLIFTVVHIHD